MGHTLALNSDATPLGLLPVSALSWHKAVKAIYLGTVDVLHEYENWFLNSPSLTIRVPSVVISKTYVKFRRTVQFKKQFVYLRDGYTCQYCGNEFSQSLLTVDHVVPKSHGGGKNFANLATSCAPCNHRRGTNTRIQPRVPPYRPTYWELVEKRKRYPITVPHESWLMYLDWPEHLITVDSPDMFACEEDERFTDMLLPTEDW